jgi:hypothetical protein
MARRSTASIADSNPVVRPLDRLLVDELNCCVRLWLFLVSVSQEPFRHPSALGDALTWRSKLVCSKRGPVMARDRGFWDRDQISVRFGACVTGFVSPPSVTVGTLALVSVDTSLFASVVSVSVACAAFAVAKLRCGWRRWHEAARSDLVTLADIILKSIRPDRAGRRHVRDSVEAALKWS